jgi:type III secretion system FlhB-like substrate exporter
VIGRTRAILNAIDSGSSGTRLLLLPALVRLPNAQTLASVARLARDRDEAVAESALGTLVRWADAGAARPLADLAEAAPAGSARRATALEGAVKHLERLPAPARAEPSSVSTRLLAATSDAGVRRRLLYLISLYGDPAALAAAEGLTADAAVGAEARDAAMAIRANALGAPIVTASGSGAQARALVDPADASFWSVPARKDQWLQIDLRQNRPVRKLVLDRSPRANDFPPAYDVFVTDDPKSPGAARVQGKGDRETQAIALPPGVYGRYVIIRLTETRDRANWAIGDLRVE